MFVKNKDVNYKILEKLDCEDLQNIATLNHASRQLLNNDTFWRNLTIKKFLRAFSSSMEELQRNVELFRESIVSGNVVSEEQPKKENKNENLGRNVWKHFHLYLDYILHNDYSTENTEGDPILEKRLLVARKVLEYGDQKHLDLADRILLWEKGEEDEGEEKQKQTNSKEKHAILKELGDFFIDPYLVLYYVFRKREKSYSHYPNKMLNEILAVLISENYISFQDNEEEKIMNKVIEYISEYLKYDENFLDKISTIFLKEDVCEKFLSFELEHFHSSYYKKGTYLSKITENMHYSSILKLIDERFLKLAPFSATSCRKRFYKYRYPEEDIIKADILFDICLEKGATLEDIASYEMSHFTEVEKYLIKKRHPELSKMIRVLQKVTLSQGEYEDLSNILSKYY